MYADAIIIGAGVIGCSTAFELAKRGYKTLNIDKNSDAGSGSTINSCAIVRAHYSTWDGVALAYEGFQYWRNYESWLGVKDERGMAKFMNCGTILLKSKGHNVSKVLELYRQIGVEYEEWDLKTLKKRMPIYSLSEFWPPSRPEAGDAFWKESENELEGAVYTPGSGYVNDPQLATHNLMVATQSQGGQFLFNKEVVEIRQEGGRVLGVTLGDGAKIDAPVVVNVAGPHSFIINRMAGVEESMNIKTRALRHEVHHILSPEGFNFEKDGMHTSDGDNAIYFRPEAGNSILVGSEDPECDLKEWIDNPDEFNRNVTDAQWKAQIYRLARRIPDLTVPNQPRGVVDLYDVSTDWLPIYDKSDLGGFYMAIGTSGHEFKNAPPVGYMMSELIHRVENGQDHDQDPVKYKAVYTGLELNVGFYSRNREINPESSFSVNG
ncbi:MAG TPA: FAD-dependent oxidoreductase [Anaerolineae bacterium]|nr:FAD-dependent oxidoreductase [Anaerolineae bacterium]